MAPCLDVPVPSGFRFGLRRFPIAVGLITLGGTLGYWSGQYKSNLHTKSANHQGASGKEEKDKGSTYSKSP